MKGGRNLADLQAERKSVDSWVKLSPCLCCSKTIKDGYYGRFGDGGVCSKNCNATHEKEKNHVPRNA